MPDSPSYLFDFYTKTKEVLELYGPFFQLDAENLNEINPLQIWSVAETDDGTHLMNGLLKGPAIDFYLLASHDCIQEAHSIDVFTSHVTDCLDCEDEACDFCDNEGAVLVEFADFITFEPVEAQSHEDLWQSRTAL